ncbi:hypothetical protein LWJ43_32665 [Streptomyces sp. JH34]|nr:alpha/beta hydrolase-fold protein [Streptomyces sp. JH34]MDF6016915.1 hypothetical protein [Streptomyces sp. JH34]MDF6023123.1 hypothetical protein [Streptomyces sp. JH34]
MFLNFLTDDLHPRIERDYGTAPGGHGLFGYSYGGLFSLYAWLTKSTFFESIGAGSPGIVNAVASFTSSDSVCRSVSAAVHARRRGGCSREMTALRLGVSACRSTCPNDYG